MAYTVVYSGYKYSLATYLNKIELRLKPNRRSIESRDGVGATKICSDDGYASDGADFAALAFAYGQFVNVDDRKTIFPIGLMRISIIVDIYKSVIPSRSSSPSGS
jgi:hypothetical protein